LEAERRRENNAAWNGYHNGLIDALKVVVSYRDQNASIAVEAIFADIERMIRTHREEQNDD